ASCAGQILGKPKHRDHAESMLRLLSGRHHEVYSGICVWSVRSKRTIVDAVCTKLEMSPLDDDMINSYLDSGLWEGKAGGFGYQDGNDWISIVDDGSESNVVGLPMERLAELLEQFEQIAENIVVDPRS
ncbi:MAG: Maf family protein, partial [Planctomycetota bacterium]